ncbi:PREDICTED: interleukin-12 receptor subunit beta-1 isoform X2 [Lepidothrix coronata]|uniref:Interleukin-12 receptor subunit beta-1 isoform X2 n=1 Tax=Lepidothrix coronata TaxID=321398 RepID=A0A6J0IZ04_9PASS|nr:PREDICTED: interleukin-12 receptor subunit beta-1 isoform X2 [Lepidothrix coronata]
MGEVRGLGENRSCGCSNTPVEQHGDQATATALLLQCMGKGMGCGSPQTLPYTTGTITAQNFSCWKKCNSLNSFHCSWSPLGPAGNTSYSLNLCWQHKGCSQFDAHKMTNYKLPHHKLYILNNAVAWVEASWEGHVHRTPNITFVFNEAEKPDPPPSRVPFSKTDGQLRLRVPRPQCPGMDQPAEREARSWRAGDSGWTQVECMTVMVKDEDDSVNCTLKGNGTFVVQLRQKTWSSYWSDWSSNISVPEEILESPVLSHQLEKLGRHGQRVLRLSWQPVLKGQRDVNYTLHAHMPACGCAELDEEDIVVLGWEVREYNLTLSGAEYEILLRAVNAAGPGPASQLHVPAEQHRDLSFKDVSVAGSTVTAQWEAPIPGEAYCFEQQVLAEAPQQGVCIQEEFPAKSIHVEKGKGAPQAPHLGSELGGGLTSTPGSCPRSTESAGVSSPCRARLGPGAGLGHLRPVAPLCQQWYVWEHSTSMPGLTTERGSRNTPPFFGTTTCRLAGRAH